MIEVYNELEIASRVIADPLSPSSILNVNITDWQLFCQTVNLTIRAFLKEALSELFFSHRHLYGSRACNQLFADTGSVSEQLPTGDLTYDMAQMAFYDAWINRFCSSCDLRKSWSTASLMCSASGRTLT